MQGILPVLIFLIKRSIGSFVRYTDHKKQRLCPTLLYPLFNKCRLLFMLCKLLKYRFKIKIARYQASCGSFMCDHSNREYTSYLSKLLREEFKVYNYSKISIVRYAVFLIANNNINKRLLFNQIKKTLFLLLKHRRQYPLPVFNELISFFLDWLNYHTLFKVCPPAFVFTVDDLSSERLAACLVANYQQIYVIYGQIDLIKYTKPPFAVDIAIVKSRDALEYFTNRSSIVHHAGKVDCDKIRVRKIPSKVRTVGILLDNFWIHDKLVEIINIIRKKHRNAILYIRYHPDTKTKPDFSSDKIVVANSNETLELYSNKCDYVISNDTTARNKVLLNGCPVVHVSGIDDSGFESCGYVKNGVILGCEAKSIKSLSMESINTFYSSKNWVTNMKKVFATDSEINAASREEIREYIKILMA